MAKKEKGKTIIDMPDITMCNNKTCPFRKECYRFVAVPKTVWQSYGNFKPDTKPHEELGEMDCDHRMKIPKGAAIVTISK